MIIRDLASSHHLITQPDHAALAARIMQQWGAKHFPDSPRKPSILRAIEHHDDGWARVDEELALDPASGRLLSYVEVPDRIKQDTSLQGIEALTDDPWARGLVAHHRLHVYRSKAGEASWDRFFERVTAERDDAVRRSECGSLDTLREDYALVRAGDLSSLVFCDEGARIGPEECGYAMHLDGTTLVITPDPFDGDSVEIRVRAREIGRRSFPSPAEARDAVSNAVLIELVGRVRGG